MHIGSLTVELLSEGRFEVFSDGHINRSLETGKPPSADLKATKHSSIVGINPILVQKGPYNILLDVGLGWGLDSGSNYTNVSNICTNLEIFGLHPDDITHVILSHLHYDHAAGSSYVDTTSKTRATFPNATYFLHQKEWDHALSQIQSKGKPKGAGYRLDELYRLKADKRIHLLKEKETELLEGISVILTGGHTPGHQLVYLQSEGECAYYAGDLLPSSSHLNHYAMEQLDVHPVQAKKEKVQLLRRALKKQAIMLFYHSQTKQCGRLIRDKDKQYVLADIPKQ